MDCSYTGYCNQKMAVNAGQPHRHTQNDRKIWKIEGPDVVRDMSVGFLLRGKSRTKRAPLNSFAQRQQTNTMAQGMCVT